MADSPSDSPPTAALAPEEWAAELSSGTPLDDRIRWACDEAGTLDPVSRHALAALCLYQQPFGFTHHELHTLARAVALVDPNSIMVDHAAAASALAKIRALLPPDPTP